MGMQQCHRSAVTHSPFFHGFGLCLCAGEAIEFTLLIFDILLLKQAVFIYIRNRLSSAARVAETIKIHRLLLVIRNSHSKAFGK
jgi:hypothetical protein